ncbi:NAD(P)H-binding protein [Actinoplanes sp. NPDC024001]|uniref:SDR family oxidoreductase n=1 Tax=Actinoplanes sp. NPDC024001 TaxID=3154598 RepID=UPI0033EB0066
MKVVVVGATGQTGRLLVEALRAGGHEVVPAARSTGIDAFTGAGLDEALAGADVVVDVTNPATREEQAVTDFFRTSTRNLTAAESKAGVGHHVVLSIVGLERGSELPYYRGKLAQEEAVRAGGVPYTIVRATQFFEFIPDVLIPANTDGDVVRLAPLQMRPIALSDLVEILVEIAGSKPVDGTVEVAGPEVLLLDEAGRRLVAPGQRVTSDGKPYFGADMPVDALVPGPDARLGTTTFDAWRG